MLIIYTYINMHTLGSGLGLELGLGLEWGLGFRVSDLYISTPTIIVITVVKVYTCYLKSLQFTRRDGYMFEIWVVNTLTTLGISNSTVVTNDTAAVRSTK